MHTGADDDDDDEEEGEETRRARTGSLMSDRHLLHEEKE